MGFSGRRVLVAGGAGYIGTHVSLALLRRGDDVFIVDDFSNSRTTSLERLARLSNRQVQFGRADISDARQLSRVLAGRNFDAVILLAGLKSVSESISLPSLYYRVNVGGAAVLLELLAQSGTRRIVFSSSATVYRHGFAEPVSEEAHCAPATPYGQTKLAIEQMLDCCCSPESGWRGVSLRYFNPVGADSSGQIGEDPFGEPNNLFPVIAQVALGARKYLEVYGSDYPTADGSGVRDFIHVSDLAEAHLAALDFLERDSSGGHVRLNVGTGTGHSVLECIAGWREATGADIPYVIADRRSGDSAFCVANPQKAMDLLAWKATRTFRQMCEDHWRFASGNLRS